MNTRKLTRTALFAALTAAGAFIRIPLGYSSITLQFLCTAMAGCLLGPAYGAASQAGVCGAGAHRPAHLHSGRRAVVPDAAHLRLPHRAHPHGVAHRPADGQAGAAAPADGGGVSGGLAMLYAVGLPYMAAILNGYMGKGMDVSAILWAGMLPFLPGTC